MLSCISRFAPVVALLAMAACGSDPAGDQAIEAEVISLPSGAKADVRDDDVVAEVDVVAGTELCDLAPYESLVDTAIADAALPDAENLRVFSINDIVTRDYIPQRTNIVHNEAGVITQVYCG